MRFLITGFAPFGGSLINPSYEAVRRLPDTVGGHRIFRAELPVVYGACFDALLSHIDATRPDCVLCLGQAAGRDGISLEYTAVNVRASGTADNAGVLYSGEKIVADGPDSYLTNLPVKEMLAGLREGGIRAKISYSAGTYVCNDLFYSLMRYIQTEEPRLLGGFVHLPADESQAGDFPPDTPLLSAADALRAVTIMIAVLGESGTSIRAHKVTP